MLKMYNKQDHAGSTPDFWEQNWEASEFEKSVAFCAIDPLRPLFEKYLRPNSLMLEGGCGMGNYVTYYSTRGYDVVGLDFAQRTMKELKTRQPNVNICGGDVSCLPFADKTFDLYYSGGVVEHFEGGARESLLEARRVLKDNGVLLMSVPYYSPLRRALLLFKAADWRRVSESAVDEKEERKDRKFFQYAYRTNEFEKMLVDVGLRTIETQGYAVLWGLSELLPLRRSGSGFAQKSEAKEQTESAAASSAKIIKERSHSLLKRLVVSEDDSVPILGLGVRIMRWATSNMMMYVCVRN